MASLVGISRVPDDDDEDDDVADLFDDEFLEHMEALKQACQMLPGAEVRLKSSSTLAASKFEEEEYEEEGDGEVDDDDDDDDALLLSIERKFLGKGGLVSGPGRSKVFPAKERNNSRAASKEEERKAVKNGGVKGTSARQTLAPEANGVCEPVRSSAPAQADSSDDEDEDLLRSVRESCGALDLVKASKHAKNSLSENICLSGGGVERDGLSEGRAPTSGDLATFPYKDGGDAKSILEEDRASFPNVEATFSEDVQAISSLDEVGRGSQNVEAVNELQSFLPAQLSDEEFDESPLPLVVHDHNFVPHGANAKVPENVQAVTEALLKNRLCQQSLRDILRQVEMKLHENKEMQRRAVSLVEYQKACTRKFCGFTEVVNSSVELIATKPVLKKKTGEFKVKGPPENPDVEIFRTIQSQLPAEFNVKKWTKKETQALTKGVRQQLQEIRLRAMMEGWDSDEEGQGFDEQMRSIGEGEEELKNGVTSVDWNEVARIYVSGRSPWECKLQWENNEDPLLNCKPWTKAEDKKLLSIVQAREMVEWAAIADELDTQRTPAQCAIRFQRSLNASILRSAWTSEEDEQLQAAVEKFGEKDWQSVAACMEGRLGSQCMSRWTKVLHPDRHRRGRWLADEDTRLKWAVSVYGPRGWKNIASHVPGRSDVQCRERWCNVLDPSVKIDDWSTEENAKLEDLVLKYGRHRWAAVGAELGRTDNQCFRHWKLLHPEHKISFKKDMAIRRAALATNFVGREKERPDLGFQDFLPPMEIGEEDDSHPVPPSRSSMPKSKVVSKVGKRASKNRKAPELSSEMNENRPIQKEVPNVEVASADVCIAVPLNSSNGPRRRKASELGEKVIKKRKLPVLASAAENLLIDKDVDSVDVASSNGDHAVSVNRSNGPRGNQARMRGAKALKKMKTPELDMEMNENLSLDKQAQSVEVASADGSNVVPLNSSNGSRKRRASQLGGRVVKKRKTPELLSVLIKNQPSEVDVPSFGVASSNGVHVVSLSSLNVSGRKISSKRGEKTKTPEHVSVTNERLPTEQVLNTGVASADGGSIVSLMTAVEDARETYSVNGIYAQEAFVIEDAEERGNVANPILVRNMACLPSDDDTAKESRDEKDAELIVYTRRKRRVSSCGIASFENSGALDRNAAWIGMSSVGQMERADEADTLTVNELRSTEPILRRHRKKLTLPDYLYSNSLS